MVRGASMTRICSTMEKPLDGCVALVAGATRGRGGRSPASWDAPERRSTPQDGRRARRSEVNRPEKIEETPSSYPPTADGRPRSPVDHLQPAEVAALIERIDGEQGRLDVLVDDIWGGDT
jgi:hypothetical protein